MSCRFIDVWPLLSASYEGSGMCPSGPNGQFSEEQLQQGLLAVNQFLPMIQKRIDGKGTLARWAVPVYGGTFTLPPDCLEVRQVFVNGCETTLRDQWYEGQIGHKVCDEGLWCGSNDLIDIGDDYAIPEEWPSQHQDTRYGVMAEASEDAGKTVQVNYKDRYGNVQMENVELLRDQQISQTEGVLTDLTYQYKGVTKGAVVGFVVYPDGRNRRLLRIPSNVTSPSYRKKKLPRSFNNCSGELSIIGKLRFTPLTSPYDTLPICDQMALSFGLQALYNLKQRDLQKYNDTLTLAVNELEKELQDNHPAGVVTQMKIKSPVRFPRRCWS